MLLASLAAIQVAVGRSVRRRIVRSGCCCFTITRTVGIGFRRRARRESIGTIITETIAAATGLASTVFASIPVRTTTIAGAGTSVGRQQFGSFHPFDLRADLGTTRTSGAAGLAGVTFFTGFLFAVVVTFGRAVTRGRGDRPRPPRWRCAPRHARHRSGCRRPGSRSGRTPPADPPGRPRCPR